MSNDTQRRIDKLTAIVGVATAMTEQRDLDTLLVMIVNEVTKVVDAERSSLFIYDRDRDELWSKVAEGSSEIRFPASKGLAGSVVTSGKIINIDDAYSDPRFNKQFDVQTGFRTRAVLTVPMLNSKGERVGVIQTLNKRDGGSFTREDEELLIALGGVAAAAISNVQLQDEIEHLFEGFVNASVVAIESRDPSTAGHSGRVAALSVALAEALENFERDKFPWSKHKFSKDALQELRYAALLHDFGKVGVRESVLVKANKLYPSDLEVIEQRYETIRRTLQLESLQRQMEVMLSGGAAVMKGLFEERERLGKQLAEVDDELVFIRAANLPAVMPQGSFERLGEIAKRTFEDSRGLRHPHLNEREVELLSIRKGTLGPLERLEIESHVVHTHRFLSQIPWTRTLRGVPDIAFGHHEKLSGNGYPRALPAESITVQSRIITITDIYDALTAADRPYKRALPHEKALDILHLEAKDGNIDRALLDLFIEARIPQRASA